jgi:hypothetical protein
MQRLSPFLSFSKGICVSSSRRAIPIGMLFCPIDMQRLFPLFVIPEGNLRFVHRGYINNKKLESQTAILIQRTYFLRFFGEISVSSPQLHHVVESN